MVTGDISRLNTEEEIHQNLYGKSVQAISPIDSSEGSFSNSLQSAKKYKRC